MKNIPEKIQTFKKCDPPEDLYEELINNYNSGGLTIDEDMKLKNPNAKKTIPYISLSTPMQISESKFKTSNDEYIGNWIYSGHGWYVRKTNEYEFAQYLMYNTSTKIFGESWDERKHKC